MVTKAYKFNWLEILNLNNFVVSCLIFVMFLSGYKLFQVLSIYMAIKTTESATNYQFIGR